jgi:hypothetical protein
MRATALTALALALVAACAPLPRGPEPVAARLSQDALRLEMSDGRICTIPRAAAQERAGGWGARVEGCAGVAAVEVALTPVRPASLRGAFEGLVRALTLEGLFAPLAEVRVTSETGRVFDFASPPPYEDED